MQELRTKLQESEDRGIILQDLADSRSAEAADAKQQCDTLLAQLEAKTVEVEAAAVQVQHLFVLCMRMFDSVRSSSDMN